SFRLCVFFFQAEDGIRDRNVTGVQTCALPIFVAGISAGASNTANYLSNDGPRARKSFTDFAADTNFGDWRTFLRGKGLFHAEYIYEHAGHQGMPLEFDWPTFHSNPAQFRVGGFDIFSGETVW